MEKEQLKNDIEGQKAITNALMDLLNEYPVLKSIQSIDFSFLEESKGIAFYALGGAVIISDKESVTGNVELKCQYPFTVVFRDKPVRENRRIEICTFLDNLGEVVRNAANTNRGRNAAVDRIPGADRRKKDNTDSANDTGTLGRKDRGRS